MPDLSQLPDLQAGVEEILVPDHDPFVGRVGEDKVLLVRVEGEIVAVGGACTHYDGPLEKGWRAGDTIRCPWHHACFSLKTGAALEAPALSPLPRWIVERWDGRLVVGQKRPAEPAPAVTPPEPIGRIVVVGAGGAGFAASQRLRQLGYAGSLILITEEAAAPYDRPELSKDFLAGKRSSEDLPLKSPDFYKAHHIDLRLGVEVTGLDVQARSLSLGNGETLGYDRLLLATGARPVRPDIPGFDQPKVHLLRTPADAEGVVSAAKSAKTVGIVGASFIGLEAAASLRQRGLAVHVIAPEALPLETKLGPELGAFIKALHEDKGVVFHLGRNVKGYDGASLTLDDGTAIAVDLVLAGVGVKPRLELASAAGLTINHGLVVDAIMRTSAPDVFAAGDIARYPDNVSGQPARVEHWVAAQRQGQVAAANMLGLQTPFAEPPFFWTEHYGLSIRYVGHAERWDRVEVDGDLEAKAAVVRYLKADKLLAVATVGRDEDALKAADALRRGASSDLS